MNEVLDFPDFSDDLAFKTRQAGKALIGAKLECERRLGSFLNNSSTKEEFIYRLAYCDDVITDVSYRKMASVSDGKAKLAKALYADWQRSVVYAEDEDNDPTADDFEGDSLDNGGEAVMHDVPNDEGEEVVDDDFGDAGFDF